MDFFSLSDFRFLSVINLSRRMKETHLPQLLSVWERHTSVPLAREQAQWCPKELLQSVSPGTQPGLQDRATEGGFLHFCVCSIKSSCLVPRQSTGSLISSWMYVSHVCSSLSLKRPHKRTCLHRDAEWWRHFPDKHRPLIWMEWWRALGVEGRGSEQLSVSAPSVSFCPFPSLQFSLREIMWPCHHSSACQISKCLQNAAQLF